MKQKSTRILDNNFIRLMIILLITNTITLIISIAKYVTTDVENSIYRRMWISIVIMCCFFILLFGGCILFERHEIIKERSKVYNLPSNKCTENEATLEQLLERLLTTTTNKLLLKEILTKLQDDKSVEQS
jgi:hypothetical protein